MLATGVPGRTTLETPPAVFGIEIPAAGTPSPAWVRSRTMKCMPARRFSWTFPSSATASLTCWAWMIAPVAAATTAIMINIATIISISVNPFSRFIPCSSRL
jgi:hypothetical protein